MKTPWATNVSLLEPAKLFAADVMKMAEHQKQNPIDIIMAMVFILGFLMDTMPGEKDAKEDLLERTFEVIKTLCEDK